MQTQNMDCPSLELSLDLTIEQLLPIMQERLMSKSSYHGIQTWKNPIDFWIYQEIIFELKPDFIIEIGLHQGGSSLALAHLLDRNHNGKLLGIDLSLSKINKQVLAHPRVNLMEGNPLYHFQSIKALIPKESIVMVIEDSSHVYENTLALLNTYGELISTNSYFIVEDGICHHGLDMGPNPGPYEAVNTFIRNNDNFVIDRTKENFLITWNPCGYLKKVN